MPKVHLTQHTVLPVHTLVLMFMCLHAYLNDKLLYVRKIHTMCLLLGCMFVYIRTVNIESTFFAISY